MIQELYKRLDHLKTLISDKDLTKDERCDVYNEINTVLSLIEYYGCVIINNQ